MAAYRIFVMLALGSLALTACSGAPTTPTPLPSSGNPSAVVMTPEEGAEAAHQHESAHAMSGNFAQSDPTLIRQVIQATARFHSTTQGGTTPTGCSRPSIPT